MTVESRLSRFAGWSLRHHWAALVAWVVVVGALAVTAGQVGSAFADDTTLPGSESQRVADALASQAPARDSVTVVVHRESGAVDRTVVGDFLTDLGATDPFVTPGSVSADERTVLATVTLDHPPGETPVSEVTELTDRELDGYQVEWSGDSVRAANESGGPAEGIGLLAALIILVPLFSSLLAATLPLITALLAVGSAVSAVILLSHSLTVPSYATAMMALVGLGVGIDYALLVFVRYRHEIRSGADRSAATSRALDTAGRSVLLAGGTVILALLGMLTLRLAAFDALAVSVALTVSATMLASITLLPALLTLFGRRLESRILRRGAGDRGARSGRRSRGAPAAPADMAANGPDAGGKRWRALASGVQRFPIPALVGGVLVLIVLALPALAMRLGFADAGTDAPDSTTRKAYDLVASAFGPGTNGPLLVLAADEASAEDAATVARSVNGVAAVVPHAPVPEGVLVTPEWGPADERTADLVHRLRSELGDDYSIGGSVPAAIDFARTVSDRLPWFIGAVVGLSALVLLVVFRSILVPIQAAISNLLSIGAALGVMTFVYGDGNLGAQPGPIEAFLPVIVFAVVFGLSMDYEVFLVSRVHEEWRRGIGAAAALREGLATTGGVITAAAAIMVVVFGSFVFSGDRMLGQMGLGLSAAVLVDAVMVRCLVVPAVFTLAGERAWWFPHALHRLPTVRLH
ncbi:MMPL family transporter [Cryptosporangium sp. NPDC048952]|uniref:MMPL family transporter n=1 Tax=Cryptosporangium sp. NPDC048952 TaxID=3363961 RepID=UPI003712FF3E